MSIETQAKRLVSLHKEKERIQEKLNQVNAKISEANNALRESFEKIGLDSNFS